MRHPALDRGRQRLAVLVSLLLLAGAIGYAGSAAFAAGVQAVSIGATLSPQDIVIAPGTTVTWTATDGGKHRIRSTSGPTELDGKVEGESWSHAFTKEGTYRYLDDEQKDNAATHGTITVSSTAPSGGGGGAASAPPAAATAAVSLTGRAFSPSTVTVAVGGTVTWTNNDGMTHNVTSSSGAFKSPNFGGGATFTFTFTAAGTYNYTCTLHGGMNGTVIVQAADGSVPPPAAPAPPGTAPGSVPIPPTVPSTPGKAGKHTVTVTDAGFTPAALDARAGDTVTWVNTGAMPHTATAAGIFDLPLEPGASASTVLQKPGTINYVCSYHDYMKATITVGAALAGVVIAPPPKAQAGTKKAGSSPAPAPGGKTKTYKIQVGDNTFSPGTVNARVGDTIVWTNVGKMPHTVTANNGSFDKTPLAPGQTFSYALRAAGKTPYVCSFHPGMAGTLVVGAALAGVAVPPASAGSTGGGAAGGSAAEEPAPASAGKTKTIEIKVNEMSFTPTMQKANVGDTISWVNVGVIPHTVTAKDGSFDKTPIAPGQRFNYVLRKEGNIDYVCTYHPGMNGMLMVGPALAGVTVPGTTSSDAATGPAALGSPHRHGELTSYEVQVKDNSFNPAMLNVRVGDTVTWVNVGKLPHTVTAKDHSFDRKLGPGQRYSLTLTKVGQIDYVCTPHKGMFGMLMVSAALTGPKPAGPATTIAALPPVSMAGLGIGWLLVMGLLTAAQLRARSSTRRRPLPQPHLSEDAS